MTLGQYAEFVAGLAGKKVAYHIEQNDSVSKAVFALMDTKKIRDLGWTPLYTVSDGLRREYQIYKARTE